MKENRILTVLGQIDETYIEEAAPGRPPRPNRFPRRNRVLLLAACLTALLALTAAAYTANWFGLRELFLPTPAAGSNQLTVSLTGYRGSPEWQALAEWQAFLADRAPDELSPPGTGAQLDTSFTRYSCYQVYSPTMAEKMEEIAAKYDLRLHSTVFDLQQHPEALEALGDFLGTGDGYYTYMYEDGTFQVEGTADLPGSGAWDFLLLRAVRGTFHDTMLNMEETSFREQSYESACGIPVTLVLGTNSSLLLTELADSFVTVLLPGGTGSGLGFSQLAYLADRIDFSALTPVLPPMEDEAAAPSATADAQTRTVYAAALRNLLYSNLLPDGTPAPVPAGDASRFAVADVDRDGKEELVLLYDPDFIAGSAGYILGYDPESQTLFSQLEDFPVFVFLDNGDLEVLSSHNQTDGALWPYSLYRYLPEHDSYESVGHVHAADEALLRSNGRAEEYPAQADRSGTGTVYYIGTDGWGTTPVDEADYLAWLAGQVGDATEVTLTYLPLTEASILTLEH